MRVCAWKSHAVRRRSPASAGIAVAVQRRVAGAQGSLFQSARVGGPGGPRGRQLLHGAACGICTESGGILRRPAADRDVPDGRPGHTDGHGLAQAASGRAAVLQLWRHPAGVRGRPGAARSSCAGICGQPYQMIGAGAEFLSRFPHYAERAVYLHGRLRRRQPLPRPVDVPERAREIGTSGSPGSMAGKCCDECGPSSPRRLCRDCSRRS